MKKKKNIENELNALNKTHKQLNATFTELLNRAVMSKQRQIDPNTLEFDYVDTYGKYYGHFSDTRFEKLIQDIVDAYDCYDVPTIDKLYYEGDMEYVDNVASEIDHDWAEDFDKNFPDMDYAWGNAYNRLQAIYTKNKLDRFVEELGDYYQTEETAGNDNGERCCIIKSFGYSQIYTIGVNIDEDLYTNFEIYEPGSMKRYGVLTGYEHEELIDIMNDLKEHIDCIRTELFDLDPIYEH